MFARYCAHRKFFIVYEGIIHHWSRPFAVKPAVDDMMRDTAEAELGRASSLQFCVDASIFMTGDIFLSL